jgi:NADP-dependent 3-hydroxy acid dehydrogenase YdfG
MKLAQKIAVVTGASSGLGKAVVEQLAAEGVKVFAVARSIETVNFPNSVIKITCNIRDLNSLDAAFAKIDAQTTQIDFLINCAGRALNKTLAETKREEIMDVFGVNLKGNIYVAQEVYKRMLIQKSGHIVNVSSTSGLKARALETIYCASKWGLRGFTESLRLEAREHGIRVSGVYPGGMQSENFWKAAPGKDLTAYIPPAEVAAEIIHLLQIDEKIAPAELVLERA